MKAKTKNLRFGKKEVEMRGIDPRTSRMLSERSTIWATSPSVDGDPKQKSRLKKNPHWCENLNVNLFFISPSSLSFSSSVYQKFQFSMALTYPDVHPTIDISLDLVAVAYSWLLRII